MGMYGSRGGLRLNMPLKRLAQAPQADQPPQYETSEQESMPDNQDIINTDIANHETALTR